MTEKVMGPDKGCFNIVQHVVYTVALFRGGEIQQQYRHTLNSTKQGEVVHI